MDRSIYLATATSDAFQKHNINFTVHAIPCTIYARRLRDSKEYALLKYRVKRISGLNVIEKYVLTVAQT